MKTKVLNTIFILTFLLLPISSHAGIVESICSLFQRKVVEGPSYEVQSQLFPKTISRLKELSSFVLASELKDQTVDQVHQQILSLLKNSGDIGVHTNLSGGHAAEYLDSGGIKATLGDSLLRGLAASGPGSAPVTIRENPSVFFWNLKYRSLVKILKSQRVSVYIVFAIKDVPNSILAEDGYLRSKMEFKNQQNNIPTSSYLYPPLDLRAFRHLPSEEYLLRSLVFIRSVMEDQSLNSTFRAEESAAL